MAVREVLFDPLVRSNPVTLQVLGICSALAVTVGLQPSLLMAVAVIAVSGFANAAISLIRNRIPTSIRLIVQIVVIATFVVVVDELLDAPEPAIVHIDQTDDGYAASDIGFVVYHRGIAVNDFRYLAAKEPILLDWGDPFYTRFERRTLNHCRVTARRSLRPA